MIFRETVYGSEDFHRECRLRHEILRAPLGLSLYEEDLSAEKGERHFGLFDPSGELTACVLAVPLSPAVAKIRQMAVRREQQGKGCGRTIMHELERHLAALGFTRLFLHARMTAAGFYEKLGYTAAGAGFMETGLPHVRMEKDLTASPGGEKSSPQAL